VDYKGDEHIDDALARLAVEFIDRHHNEPMFLYIASPSPHNSMTPANRYKDSYKDVRLPQSPSFNEEDISDKPSYVRRFPIKSADDPGRLEGFRIRLRTLLSVEDSIRKVMQVLDKYDIKNNTYFVFVSDNGWQYGEHRIPHQKLTPYQASNTVPAWIWGSGIPEGLSTDYLVANSDLAQTFAEWAGAKVPNFVDGRSLVRLLGNIPVPRSQWRQVIPLAYRQELFTPWPNVNTPFLPEYFGLLTNSEKYVHYSTLEQELYLHDSDPYEMDSRHENPLQTEKIRQLLKWAQAFGSCYGDRCRLLDQAPPSD